MNEAMMMMMLRQLVWISLATFLGCSAEGLATGYFVNPNFEQCDGHQCREIDDILTKHVNSSREPCDDFFEYACGNYSSMVRSQSHYMSLDNANDYSEGSNFEDLDDILSGVVSLTTEENGLESLTTERSIYDKCKRVGVYTEDAKDQYRRWLRKNAGPLHHNDHWTSVDKKFALEGFGFAFFDVDIVERTNYGTGNLQRFIQISPPTDNILHINYLLSSKYMEKLQYGVQSRNVYPGRGAGNYGYGSNEHPELEKFIDAFNKIVPYNKFDDANAEDVDVNKLTTVLNWQRKYDEHALHLHSKIQWRSILNSLFEKYKKIYEDEQIIVTDDVYFKHLSKLLTETNNMTTIVEYINLRGISKTIGSVVEEYKDRYSIFPPIKGLSCTPGLMVGANHVYARQYFPHDNKETIKDIFNDIVKQIVDQLGPDNFQDKSDETENFLRELRRANLLIGYPDWLYNDKFVKNFYESRISISDVYYVNQLRLKEILLKHKLKAYTDANQPLIDEELYFRSFTEDKISFKKDSVVLPVKAFSENNFKFVSSQLFDPINYGAAGTLIAYELYSVWLKQIGYSTNATRCIKQQMPSYKNEDRANKHLLKSTAYLLGLRAAFDAWPSKDSYPIQFPRFGAVTDYPLFFDSFAESLCIAKDNIGELKQHINFAVSNMEEFSDAFQCSTNHAMNRMARYKKCDPLKYD